MWKTDEAINIEDTGGFATNTTAFMESLYVQYCFSLLCDYKDRLTNPAKSTA